MRFRLAPVAVVVLALAGCTAAPEPVVVQFEDLPGSTIEVPLDTTLVVQTGDDDLEGMRADIADPAVVEFREGANTGEVGYYPLFTPLAAGRTDVAVTSPGGDFEFTITVTPIPAGGNLGGLGR